MPKVAVLGANGQLGQSLQAYAHSSNDEIQWNFFDSTAVDVTKITAISSLFAPTKKYDYILNFAAYTAVDQAEHERARAFAVNARALQHLARACQKNDVVLIHLSTDYVFDGNQQSPYKENDPAQPLNYYGATKLQGEDYIRQYLDQYYILRSGWVYSSYGNNFYKTMKRLAKTHDTIRVVNDQIGTPTHTSTVIEALLKIIHWETQPYGTYHIGNRGKASWFEFADTILSASGYSGKCEAIPTSEYPTTAKRPRYSVLDKRKFEKTFAHTFPDWKISFEKYQKKC